MLTRSNGRVKKYIVSASGLDLFPKDKKIAKTETGIFCTFFVSGNVFVVLNKSGVYFVFTWPKIF